MERQRVISGTMSLKLIIVMLTSLRFRNLDNLINHCVCPGNSLEGGKSSIETKIGWQGKSVANCNLRFVHFVENTFLNKCFQIESIPMQKCFLFQLPPTFLPQDKSSTLCSSTHFTGFTFYLWLSYFFHFIGLITQVWDNKLEWYSTDQLIFCLTSR